MPKKKDETKKEALTLREFIKLLRKDKTIADLDRIRVYDVKGDPITSVSESNGDTIVH